MCIRDRGNIEINPVTASISNSNREAKIVSNRVKLNVKKLPAGMPETFKNAVGKFDIAVVNNNATEVSEIQKPVNVTMKVSGAGNFGTLHLPKIVNSNDYIFYPPKITARTTTHQNELSGVVTADYAVSYTHLDVYKRQPYNETIRKNYEIAMRKEKEKQQQQQQKNNSDGGAGDNKNKDQNQGEDKGNTPKQEQGNGQQNKGEGEGNDPDQSKNNDADKMPKDLENSILNRVENKERETAKRILNKNSYSMPQSNEKDW